MRTNKWLTLLLVVLVAIVWIDQVRFLFVYPVPDTGMWFGDESWTMLTLRALARTGVARVPEALSSSLAHSNGFVNGSVWITGMIYGVPALIFDKSASPVAIGRVVTEVLSLCTIVLLFRLSRRMGISVLAMLIAILSLLCSNGFYFSSHSARLDMATGFAVLVFFYYLIILFEESQIRIRDRSFFLFTFFSAISLTIYVHVPTLIVLPLVYSLWYFGVFRNGKRLMLAFTGIVFGTVILLVTYRLSVGSIHLLGSGYNQYYNVANSIPILHLTSWRVQKINTIDRAVQVWEVSWPLVTLILVGVALRIWKRVPYERKERFILLNTALLLIGWGLFGGPAVFYNIYVMPILALCAAIFIRPVFKNPVVAPPAIVLLLFIVAVATFALIQQEQFGSVGRTLCEGNNNAVRSILRPVESSAKPPLILTDEPGENELNGNRNVRLMTNHFLLFGEEDKSVPEILRENHVEYLLLYSCTPWKSPFQRLADSLYTKVDARVGMINDLGRSYDDPNWQMQDTLRLYRLKQ